MARGIFINYRRADTIATAGRLNDRLVKSFGKKRIFMDVDHIPVGADFADYIEAQLSDCGVLLALIGPHWLHTRDDGGSPRLSDPNDLVSREIGLALSRGIDVIPVLVDGASMPKQEELPDAIKPLVRRNAIELRNTQFGADADRLITKIGDILADRVLGVRRWRAALVATAAILFLAFAAWTLLPIDNWRRSRLGETIDVEDCNRTLGPITSGLDFSGVFKGSIVDSDQKRANIQLKLVRNGDSVQGSYLRAGICGTVTGRVSGEQLEFYWKWADSAGSGSASQLAGKLSGTSGFGTRVEGGGSFELFE
jgi:hypothetical protein